MEAKAMTGIAESPADWEAGNVPTPAATEDRSRVSPPGARPVSHEDEANSDLGNLGRDVHDAPESQPSKAQ